MKNIIFGFLFFNLISVNLNAQVLDTLPWAPKGATWLYIGGFFGGDAYGKFTYTSDTTILNKKVKVFAYSTFEIYRFTANSESRTKESFVQNYYYYASHDSIFWYNANQFNLLYVFNAKVNDVLKIPKNNFINYSVNKSKCIDSFNIDSNTVKVTEIVEFVFSNKRFTATYTSAPKYWSIGGPILKNIGPVHNPLFPLKSDFCSGIDEFLGVPTGLVTYYDSLRGCVNVSYIGDCLGLITASKDLPSEVSTFVISPNPVQDVLHISKNFSLPIKSIKIYDLMGREFLSLPNFVNESIDVTQLSDGIYFLKVETADSHFISTKFLKMK